MKCVMNGCDLILQMDDGETRQAHGDLWKVGQSWVFVGNYNSRVNEPTWLEALCRRADKTLTIKQHDDFWERRGVWIIPFGIPQFNTAAEAYLAKWDY